MSKAVNKIFTHFLNHSNTWNIHQNCLEYRFGHKRIKLYTNSASIYTTDVERLLSCVSYDEDDSLFYNNQAVLLWGKLLTEHRKKMRLKDNEDFLKLIEDL